MMYLKVKLGGAIQALLEEMEAFIDIQSLIVTKLVEKPDYDQDLHCTISEIQSLSDHLNDLTNKCVKDIQKLVKEGPEAFGVTEEKLAKRSEGYIVFMEKALSESKI